MTRIRKIWNHVFRYSLLLASMLALVEIGLRLSGLGPSAIHTVSTQEFDRIPGMYSPTARVTVRQVRELPYELSINSLGYRGAEFPKRKPAGEFRIVVVGDSIVFGEFVDDDETLPATLEEELRRACPAVRTINAGLSGSSIISQQHVAMRSLAVAPDLVLLVFSENDVSGLAGVPYWDQLADARQRKSSFPLSIAYAVGRDTALWTALMRARANIRAAVSHANREQQPAVSDTRRVDELRARYGDLLTELHDALALRNTPLITTAFPSHLTLRRLAPEDRLTWFAEAARQRGLPYVDVYGWLADQAESGESFYQLPWDGHPSPLGHAKAAARLAQDLVRQPPLAARCAPSGR